MTFRVANVTKPLASVASVCEKGNQVLFTDARRGGKSYILNNSNDQTVEMKKENGAYVIEVPLDNITNHGK